MTFKETIRNIEGKEEAAGLVIMQAVLENRIENESAYRRGKAQNFRNLECQRVLRGLEKLAEGENESQTVAMLIDRFGDRLNAYRDIHAIHFIYDGTKFLYQMSTGSSTDKLTRTIAFIRETVLPVPLQKESAGEEDEQSDYRWERETERQEYVRIINAVKRGLKRQTGFIFYEY